MFTRQLGDQGDSFTRSRVVRLPTKPSEVSKPYAAKMDVTCTTTQERINLPQHQRILTNVLPQPVQITPYFKFVHFFYFWIVCSGMEVAGEESMTVILQVGRMTASLRT